MKLIQGYCKDNAHHFILFRGNSKTWEDSSVSNHEEIRSVFKKVSDVFKLTRIVRRKAVRGKRILPLHNP